MSATISQVFRNKLLQAYFQKDVFAYDERLYVALTGQVGQANADGSSLDEPEVSAYQRAAVPLTSDYWSLTGFGDMFNNSDVAFVGPDPGEDWGQLSGWALLDAPDGGMVQAVGSLVLPTFYTSDMPPIALPPAGITIRLTD